MRATCLIHHTFLNVTNITFVAIIHFSPVYCYFRPPWAVLRHTPSLSYFFQCKTPSLARIQHSSPNCGFLYCRLYDCRVCKQQAAIIFINLLAVLMDYHAIIAGGYTGRVYPVERKRSKVYLARKAQSSTRLWVKRRAPRQVLAVGMTMQWWGSEGKCWKRSSVR